MCHEPSEGHQVEFSVLLFDHEGRRMPGARCRVFVRGIEVNVDTPYADRQGWVTVCADHGPEIARIEWAPADTPRDPRFPYRHTSYVRLRGSEWEEAGCRRLHNLGFGLRRTLCRNVADFQRHFDYAAITGELADIEDDLRLYHDLGCMPAVTNAELEERLLGASGNVRRDSESEAVVQEHASGKPVPRKPPAAPPLPPPSQGHPKFGGGTPPGQVIAAPWLQPRPLVPIRLRLESRERGPYAYRGYEVQTEDGMRGPFETDADGLARFEIPAGDEVFAVDLLGRPSRGTSERTRRWTLCMRTWPPASTPVGAMLRLRHLDYWAGGISDDWDDMSRNALGSFQAVRGLPTTGVLDGATAGALDQASTYRGGY